MAGEITEEQIIEELGDVADKFKLERYENGNFQVTIANMGAIRDYSKMKLLVTGCERLWEAELIPHPDEIFRLSWKTRQVDDQGDPIFRPYPTIWVNQPGRTETAVNQNSEEIESVREELDQLKAILAGMKSEDEPAKKEVSKKKGSSKKPSQKKGKNSEPESAPLEETQGEEVPFGF